MTGWSLTAVSLGALEGGLLGVIVKNQFAEVTSHTLVNLAVAVVAGAPSFANLFSFLFASLSVGRDKIVLLSQLMIIMGVCLVLMAFPGRSLVGLIMFTAAAVVARTAWSGILTVRAVVWRANYERQWRGQVAARIVQVASLLVAVVSALIGFLMDWHAEAWRLVFPMAGICSLVAAWSYSKTRVRHHRRLMTNEQHKHQLSGRRLSLGSMLEVLAQNAEFRAYMLAMMIFGSGNLMVVAMLVVIINEQFQISPFNQVLITASLPLLVLCLAIGFWARLLDRRHIFGYRAIHSWNFVAAHGTFAIAVIAHIPELLWPGAVLLGSAYAGGHLGWNLGHNDFSDDANASLYMAIHVSLTGLRGLMMPIFGVVLIGLLESRAAGLGVWAMLLPVALVITGSLLFVWLHHRQSKA